MSLSQENINKLCMTGIYHCDPVLSWIESWRRDNPYHCINWTFKVYIYDEYNKIYMRDTYWSGGSGLIIKLTDENFDKFNLLFDMNDVHRVSPPDFYDYNEEDRWHIALDSGGYQFSKHYYVRNGAKKNKEVLLERLNRELDTLRDQVKWKEGEIQKVLLQRVSKDLPPVNPTKTGKWILIDKELSRYKCSECGEIIKLHKKSEISSLAKDETLSDYPFSHCGARMIEAQERSDKE